MTLQSAPELDASKVDAGSARAADADVLQAHTSAAHADQSRYLIVGGGSGGLELACKLGRKLGHGKVTLVDTQLDHVWKPSLHGVAAGTLDVNQEGLSNLMLGHDNGFDFILGSMIDLDADARQVSIGKVVGNDGGTLLPQRLIGYENLVIAVGSTANHFGVSGAEEHTIALNDAPGAELFRQRLLKAMAAADRNKREGKGSGIDIVIIGAGATGVELAAELRDASKMLSNYGFRQLDPIGDVRLTVLEGAPRVLPPLPEKVAAEATELLRQRQVSVHTGCKVAAITSDHVEDDDGNRYPADLCVWTAGIKAPAFLSELGLATTENDLLVVDSQLRVQGHDDIYALGDCAYFEDGEGNQVPPRAQTAHQQADHLLARFVRQDQGKVPSDKPYRYQDYGSLVSLGQRRTVGSLMGPLSKSSWFVEGLFARTMYTGLHLMHQRALLGTLRSSVLAVARFLVKRSRSQVKMH